MKRGERFLLGLVMGVFLSASIGFIAMSFFHEQICASVLCRSDSSLVPISDRGYFPAAYRELEGAEESIHVLAFELKYYEDYPDSNQNRIVEALIDAHGRGVDVKILVDEYSKTNNAYDLLKDKGMQIRYDSESVTTHAKLIIIDGKTVILGSTNFSYYGLEKNHETDILVQSEHVAEYFEGYFKELWSIQRP